MAAHKRITSERGDVVVWYCCASLRVSKVVVTVSAVKRTCPQWCNALSMTPAKSQTCARRRIRQTCARHGCSAPQESDLDFCASTCDEGISPTSAAGSGWRRCLLRTEAFELWLGSSPIRCPDERAIMNALWSQFHNFVSVVRDTWKLNPSLWRPAMVNSTSFSPQCTLVWFSPAAWERNVGPHHVACFLSLAGGCVRTSAQFTSSHVLCYISGCLMGPQSVGVNTPPGWRHSCFHSPRSRRHSRYCPRRYNPAADSAGNFHGMAPHSLEARSTSTSKSRDILSVHCV